MTSDAVGLIYQDFLDLRQILAANADASGLVALERTYPKALLLASASNLEVLTTAAILKLWDDHPRRELQTFVERKSLTRNFHTLFNWDRPSGANQFFSLFGSECLERFKRQKAASERFSESVSSFLDIVSLRNQLVHQDYAEFPLARTAEEIMTLYESASLFPEYIRPIVFDEDAGG